MEGDPSGAQPDRTVAFGEETPLRERDVDEPPGVAADHAAAAPGDDGERPPLAVEDTDTAPLRERFGRTEA